MADYYPLIARAVTGLDKSTGEARRALYERARTALVTQLRGVEPALSEADITRERLALEDAIRKVEAESARRPRQEAPEPPRFEPPVAAVPPPPPPPPPEPGPTASETETPPPEDWRALQRELEGFAPPEPLQTPEQRAESDEPPLPLETPAPPPAPPGPAELPKTVPWDEPPIPPRRLEPKFSDRGSLVDEGLKGFRDVIAETEKFGAAPSKTARDKREPAPIAPPAGEAARLKPRAEPRFGSDDFVSPDHEAPPPPPRPDVRAPRAPIAPSQRDAEDFEEIETRRLRSGAGRGLKVVIALAVIAVLAGGGYFVFSQLGGVGSILQSARPPATQASKEAPQSRPKIGDRIGGAPQDPARSGPAAAVAQRAILYEQGATPQERKQYVGSVIWKTENTSAGPGQPVDIAVKGDVEIPERHIRMNLTIRRNLDQSLPISHTLEIAFTTPADFQPGGVADVPGVVMEAGQPGSGAPLRGHRVKVTAGFFLIGLSSAETDVQRNVQLLKERAWLYLRMAYNNGQNALLTIEKGVPGDRVFEEALNAWGQNPPKSGGG
jgi:hypothetical protein